jgi:amidohydrolase
MIKEIIKLRKELHRFPELSGKESETADRIASFIASHTSVDIIRNIGGNGLAAVFEFSKDGPTVMIRCDLDALPIRESNDFEHRSVNDGVSHKCGHDGHMAILCNLALITDKEAYKTGRVILLFQPAEENATGAKAVIEDPKFKDLRPDLVFALHNLPGYDKHSIIINDGRFTPSVISMALSLKGKTAHAGQPEKGINPAHAIAEIIKIFEDYNEPNLHSDNYSLITPVHIKMGDKDYGISPGDAEIHYTIRTNEKKMIDHLIQTLDQRTAAVCKHYDLTYQYDTFEFFPSVQNHLGCSEMITNAAKKNKLQVYDTNDGIQFGEDFGWFTEHFNGALFGLGAGINTPALHNDDYDFPDELIATGTDMFRSIIKQLLK